MNDVQVAKASSFPGPKFRKLFPKGALVATTEIAGLKMRHARVYSARAGLCPYNNIISFNNAIKEIH